MARVQTTRHETVPGDASAVLAAIHAAAQRDCCRLEGVQDWELEVRRGSQAVIRLLGLLARARSVPVVAAVRVTPVEGGAVVDVNALDDLGFGVRAGANEKITAAVNELADLLISAARTAPSRATAGSRAGAVSVRCAQCGAPLPVDARFCASCGAPAH